MKVSKFKPSCLDGGYYIILEIGNRQYRSYFNNPSPNIDHAHLEYFTGRYPIIRTEKRMNKFKELYKQLFV